MLRGIVLLSSGITSDEPVALWVRLSAAVPYFTMEAEVGFCASTPLPVYKL